MDDRQFESNWVGLRDLRACV